MSPCGTAFQAVKDRTGPVRWFESRIYAEVHQSFSDKKGPAEAGENFRVNAGLEPVGRGGRGLNRKGRHGRKGGQGRGRRKTSRGGIQSDTAFQAAFRGFAPAGRSILCKSLQRC